MFGLFAYYRLSALVGGVLLLSWFLPAQVLGQGTIKQGVIKQEALEEEVAAWSPLKPDPLYAAEAISSVSLLSNWHYKKMRFNDSLSFIAFEHFIDELDPNKMYFLRDDFDRYAYRYGTELDDMIDRGDLSAAYVIFNDFIVKFLARLDWLEVHLGTAINLEQTDHYDRKAYREDWHDTSEALDTYWDKVVRNSLISLCVAGKDIEGAAELLRNRYAQMRKNLLKTHNRDIFEIFMRSVATSYDPHTAYFSPITAENFNINMSNSLEGIGAQLISSNLEYVAVNDVIIGGPAHKEGSLKKNDKIIGVAQGEDGSFVDVVGWRLDDVVQLIRGDRGTTVRLQVVHEDNELSNYVEITLVREKVTLEDALATKELLEVDFGGKAYTLGVIRVPSFYLDFEASRFSNDYKSVSKDVRRLLEELKEEGVKGVLLDMRQNGGGALSEAVELTGLFIKQGGVVQVKNTNNQLEIIPDDDPGQLYDGPLMVLVDRFSASATEIFAGAIQDYNRGLVIGEPTFGKGTVQQLVPLENIMPAESIRNKRVGQIKLTTAKFYRITGKSTQKKGITPDLALPSRFLSKDRYREAAKNGALKWDQINNVTWSRKSSYGDILEIATLKNYLQSALEEEKWQSFTEAAAVSEQERGRSLPLSLQQRQAATAKDKKDETVEENEENEELSGESGGSNQQVEDEDLHLNESLVLLANLVSIRKDR